MIKSIVEKIMVKEFSKYINGIEYNKLTIEVLGGYFSIQNISLNHHFFNSLETPFLVAFSHIGKLSIEAPLTKLSSVPVSCTVEDVYVIVQLKKHATHLSQVSKEELLNKYIRQTFDLLVSKVKDANKEEGMLDKLGKKIIDNLKFQVKNIHIRFQESNSLHSYSFGVSLKSLTFGTTDRNWKPVYIEREKSKEEEPIFKCMNIQNFRIYWQSISKDHDKHLFLRSKDDQVRIQAMRKYVQIDQDSFLTINCMVKLIINPSSNTKLPLIELEINLDAIDIKFSKQKIVEVLDFTTSCIKHNEVMLKTLLDKATKKVNHDQEQKMRPLCQYYTRNYLQTLKEDSKKGPPKEKADFSYLFDSCTIEDLYEWSMEPIKQKVQELREKEIKKQRKGWFSSAQVKLSPEERKQLEKLLDELAEDSIGGKGRPADSILLKLVLNLKGLSFFFYDENTNNRLKTISLRIDNISCFLEKSHNKSWFSVENRIKRIEADLQLQEEGRVKKVQVMENLNLQQRDDNLLEVVYRQSVVVTKNTKISYHLDVTLGKTLFIYKKQYWKMFNSFFSLPEINQQVQNQALGKLELLKGESSDSEAEMEIIKTYNVELSLMSPSFILPLSDTSCWYLDLGTIKMRSSSAEDSITYPFKLRQLSMRYIDTKGQAITTKIILTSDSFFPIVKDINVDVNIITKPSKQQVHFDISLQKIQLSATRQQFVNLLNVKKFLVGEEKDQLQTLEQLRKAKEDIEAKAKLKTKLSKRGKYLHNWSEYYCCLSNNNIYFFLNESQLIPEAIASMRGARCQKHILESEEQTEYQLQIAVGSEITYLHFHDKETLTIWQEQLKKSVLQLQNMDTLMLQGGNIQRKKHKQRKEEMVSLNLELRSMSWNYISEKGETYMKIELNHINFQVQEKQEEVSTSFTVAHITIFDRVFEYQNKNYQHLIQGQKLLWTIQKAKEKVTKISPVVVGISLDSLNLNWKPDALLIIIQSIKEFMDIKPLSKNRDKSKQQIINLIKKDHKFINRHDNYLKSGSGYTVKDRRDDYLRINSKEDEIFVKFSAAIRDLKTNFIHRQSHMPMFTLSCQDLSTAITLAKHQTFVDGRLGTFDLFQIFGYPQKQYNINTDYAPFCLIQKKGSNSLNAVEFKYSSYEGQQIANEQRVDSFLRLNFSPLTISYLQEVTMRLIDYFLIQIILLLSKPDMITVNENILNQLLSGKGEAVQKPKNFLEDEFEQVVKRFFQPFFMDYQIVLNQPEIILAPTKDYCHYFVANVHKISVHNRQIRTPTRFGKVDYAFKNMLYEEQIIVQGQQFILTSINNKFASQVVPKPFDCEIMVNRLLFQDEINWINPEVNGYDRSFKITNHITPVEIPQLPKFIYENMVRLPNFNLTFEDLQEEMFIHNYRITKTLSPKPIEYNMIISSFQATAQHSIDENRERSLKLFRVCVQKLEVRYRRDEKLNSLVEIALESASSNTFQYQDNDFKTVKMGTLARINKTTSNNNCYFLIKLPNTTQINIQGVIQDCQLYLNVGVLPLIADWVQVEDSVFAISTKISRPIFCLIRIPKIEANLQDQRQSSSLKTMGDMVIEVARYAGQSESFLKQGFESRTIKPDYIQKLKAFMQIKLRIGFQFYSCFKGQDRKILDKLGIEFQELNHFRVRNNNFTKTANRKLKLSELKGSISIDDIILFKYIGDTISKGQVYQKRFKEILQAEFCKSQLLNQSVLYKDVLKEQKVVEEFNFRVEGIKFYLISKEGYEYIPIFRLLIKKMQCHQFINSSSEVIYGDFNMEVSYFNDEIFGWQPLLEPVSLKMNVMKNDERHKLVELDVTNEIYLNLSRQNATSIKKYMKAIEQKLDFLQENKYLPDMAASFISRYIIKNQTGYPIQILNQDNLPMYVVMNGDQIHYTSKAIFSCFFEENHLKETISFHILHPKQEFLPITTISLQSFKSFDIDLYSSKGIKMPQACGLYLEIQVQGCKKILTIRSKKFITDYTQGNKKRVYYPFDNDQNVVLKDHHKGFKANFFKEAQSERFFYKGSNGHIVIRKKYLVYNYTMIPLNISDYMVVPGEFIGINSALTIQGVSSEDSCLKVVYNQKKKEYYIYSISYIIDYTGLHFSFDSDYQINKLYSYSIIENGRAVRVYLLPDINTNFTVAKSRSSSSQLLKGKLAKQTFQIVDKNKSYLYSCFSRLQTFCQQNIKEFRKVIEITDAYMICNDTEYLIRYKQVGSPQQPSQLGSNKNATFNWSQKSLKQLIEIAIVTKEEELKSSAAIPIGQDTETFIVRSKVNQRNFKILSLQLEQTNNVTFIHIIDASKKIEILNSIPQSFITVYQTVIFENKNVLLAHPENYIYHMGYKERKAFGYQLPKHDHTLTVQIELNQEHYSWKCPSFSISDLENNLIEKTIEIKGKELSHNIVIALQFHQHTKTVELSLKKREIFHQKVETQIKCKLKAVYLSLIGLHQSVRKELVNCSLKDLNLNFYINQKLFESSFSAKTIRVQNTLKTDPYFISLLRQAQESERPAFLFALKKSRSNPKLVYYIGFSILRSVLTVTSEELQILQQNFNGIMQKLNEKSDTNCLLNLQEKFTPKKIRNDEKIYFAQAEIHPLKLIMTYKHVNNWGGALLRALSINQCKVKVDGKKINNFVSKDLLDFTTTIGTHFKEGFANEIFSMIGSLALLGSPLNLASKIGCGLSNLINLPADGFEGEGVLGVGKGLALGTGSLLSNTLEGAFGTVESITGTIGNGISGFASYDKNFQKKRQEIKNERVDHIGQGLISGGKSIFNGVLTGITGLVKQPLKGAEKQGLGGFFKGGLKGLTGLVVKPVSGVIDATSKTAEGIKNTTKVFSKQTKELRTRRYIPRPFYNYSREIRNYDKDLAAWNIQLSSYRPKYEILSWVGLIELRGGDILALTYEYLLVLAKFEFEVKVEINASDLVNVAQEKEKISIVYRDQDNQKRKLLLDPKKKEQCLEHLQNIYHHYQKNYETGIYNQTQR